MAFFNKMKGYLDKGVEVSKNAFTRAGSAVQTFGDKSVTRIEIKQLEGKLNAELLSLGKQTFMVLCTDKEPSIASDDSRISGILAEIKRINVEIANREEALKAEENASESSAEGATTEYVEQSSVNGEILASEAAKESADDAQIVETEKK